MKNLQSESRCKLALRYPDMQKLPGWEREKVGEDFAGNFYYHCKYYDIGCDGLVKDRELCPLWGSK